MCRFWRFIDAVLGLSYVAGNNPLYLTLLDRFRQSQRHAMEELREAIGNGERAVARLRAHTFASLTTLVRSKSSMRRNRSNAISTTSQPPILRTRWCCNT